MTLIYSTPTLHNIIMLLFIINNNVLCQFCVNNVGPHRAKWNQQLNKCPEPIFPMLSVSLDYLN